SRRNWLRHKKLQVKLDDWYWQVAEFDNPPAAQATFRLKEALRDESPAEYPFAYEEVAKISNLEFGFESRPGLFRHLPCASPAWASAVDNRVAQHGQPQVPGDPDAAWEWRQLHDELERRARVSLDQLQQRIEDLSQKLLNVTAQLVEKQTWMNQIRQTGSAEKHALGAYALMRKKLTKTGKGVRDADLRAAARREITTAKDAVPVWIMPLFEVAETFDPRKTRFDVVIIDEASQCDPTSLFALYLGHQTIVVGDDEQVTPVAVGTDTGEVKKLIDTYLDGIPHKDV